MALTKHQKLARKMRSLFASFEDFYQRTARQLNVLQFYFYETYLIVGRPLMAERTIQVMMYTHRIGLIRFSENKELLQAAKSSPLIGLILTPTYPSSRCRVCPKDIGPKERDVIPWGTKIMLPSETLQGLENAKLRAILFCASEEEMPGWIDWSENEDKANTFTNLLLTVHFYEKEQLIYRENLNQPIMNEYQKAMDSYPEDKIFPLLEKLENSVFTPNRSTSAAVAYRTTKTYMEKEQPCGELFKFLKDWCKKLEELIFSKLNWPLDYRQACLSEIRNKSIGRSRKHLNPRKTSLVLDPVMYGKFLYYFAEQFTKNSFNKVDGEITLLLWIMIYASRDLRKMLTIEWLLGLNTKHIADRIIDTPNGEVEISCGLADLIREYTGGANLQRQQKLFPNLNPEKLKYHFEQASRILLGNTTPALPEAFLVFPYAEKGSRMDPYDAKRRQRVPQRVYYDPISREELKQQLVEKSRKFSS